MATCETCRWWNGDDAQSSVIAECRRNAPQPADNLVDPAWWAFTKRHDWCGEHQPKEADHNEREEFDMATQYLSENDISVIRERFHGWERASAKTLAAIFGVSVQRIASIVKEN